MQSLLEQAYRVVGIESLLQDRSWVIKHVVSCGRDEQPLSASPQVLSGFQIILIMRTRVTLSRVRSLAAAGFLALLVSPVFATEAPSVVVRLGDVEVTTLDLDADLQRMSPEQRRQAVALPDDVKRLAGTILYWRKIAQEARAAGVDADPLVAAQLLINQERLLGEIYLLKADLENVPPAYFEELARTEYNAHPERFTEPAQVSASHILVSTNNRKAEEVEPRLAEVMAALAAGKPFAEVATEFSDDPVSAQRGGDLGSFGRGRMVKPFEDAAFRLSSPGDVSAPVRTQFGWHIIRLNERSASQVRPFDEIRAQLIAELRAKWVADKRHERAMAMQNADNLKFDDAVIEAFSSRQR